MQQRSRKCRVKRRSPITSVIDVHTGGLRAAQGETILLCNAIGSCIAIVLYDAPSRAGGLAHAMLPGRAHDPDDPRPCRYIENAVDTLVREMNALGARKADLEACVAGGGNVLRRPDDTVCRANAASVREYLALQGIPVRAASLGGCQRRRVEFDVSSGTVHISAGSGPRQIFWSAGSAPAPRYAPGENGDIRAGAAFEDEP